VKAWIAVGIVVASGTLAALASAGDVATFDTRLIMRETAPAFHGRIKSDSRACEVGRQVKLLRRTRPGRPTRLLGSDLTNSRGKWAVTEPDEFTLKSGIYFSRAPKVILNTPVPTICTKDRSRKIVVD
jgi:hypothetical protein